MPVIYIRLNYSYYVFTVLLVIFSSVLNAESKWLEFCEDCHGPNGNSQHDSVPSIAALSKNYFVDSMSAFKRGERVTRIHKRPGAMDTDMNMVVSMLLGYEITELAEWYSSQIMDSKAQSFDSVKAKMGRRLHMKYCETCHENSGRSIEDDVGILPGQKSEYLRLSLQDIASGKRISSKKMKSKLNRMKRKYGSDAFDHLVHYYASLIE